MIGEPERIRPALTFTDLLECVDSNNQESALCLVQNPWAMPSVNGSGYLVFRCSDEVVVHELEHQSAAICTSRRKAPDLLPLHLATFTDIHEDLEFPCPPTFCDDMLTCISREDDEYLTAHIFTTAATEKSVADMPEWVHLKYDTPQDKFRTFQFCPLTGRLCILSEDNGIYVLDYIERLSS